MKRFLKIFLMLFLGFFSIFSSAKDKELEKFVNETKLLIYSQPLKVIEIGDSLYSNEYTNIKEKTAGLLLISDALISVRNYSQALEYVNIAQDLLNHEEDQISEVKVLSRYAYIYFQLDLYDDALKYLKQAEEKNVEVEEEYFYANLGYILAVKGMIYRNLVNCEMGLRYFERSLEAFNKSPEDLGRISLSVVHYNMGNCFLAMDDFESAEKNFKKAYEVAGIFKQERNSLKLYAEKGLANIFISRKEYEEAIKILEELYKDAEKIDDKSLLRSITSDLAQSYLQVENWVAFQEYDLKNKEIEKDLMVFKKEATINALNGIDKTQTFLINKKHTKVRNQILFSSVIFLVFIFLLGYKIRGKRKNIRVFHSKIFSD